MFLQLVAVMIRKMVIRTRGKKIKASGCMGSGTLEQGHLQRLVRIEEAKAHNDRTNVLNAFVNGSRARGCPPGCSSTALTGTLEQHKALLREQVWGLSVLPPYNAGPQGPREQDMTMTSTRQLSMAIGGPLHAVPLLRLLRVFR